MEKHVAIRTRKQWSLFLLKDFRVHKKNSTFAIFRSARLLENKQKDKNKLPHAGFARWFACRKRSLNKDKLP
jgi:hypothetical protein